MKSFIDLGEFEAIKILSGLRALCCDKHRFHAKMAVRTQTVFEISLLNIVVLTRKTKNTKMVFLLPHTFALYSASLLGNYMSIADHKGTQRGNLST